MAKRLLNDIFQMFRKHEKYYSKKMSLHKRLYLLVEFLYLIFHLKFCLLEHFMLGIKCIFYNFIYNGETHL